jgi:hypothetical protein
VLEELRAATDPGDPEDTGPLFDDENDPNACKPILVDHWVAVDDLVYVTANGMSASRLGPDRSPLAGFDPALIPPAPDGASGEGRGVPRIGRTGNIAFGGGGYGADFSVSRSRSRNRLDFQDLNGDGFPDVIASDRVQFTEPTGVLEEHGCGQRCDAAAKTRRRFACPPMTSDWPDSTRCARNRCWVGERRASRSSTRWAS